MHRLLIVSLCCLMCVQICATYVPTPGSLRQIFDSNNMWDRKSIAISGAINGSDVKVLREWVRNDRTLDLSECSIVKGGEPYYENYTTEDDVIGPYMFVFKDCNLQKLVLPKNLKKIDDYAIGYCGEEIDLPPTLTWVGDHAFTANNFKRLHIPATLTHIGNGAFNGNNLLVEVTLDEANPEYVLEDGFLYTRDHTRLLSFFASVGETWDSSCLLPQLKIIDDKALNHHRIRNIITLPDELEYIGEEAFKYANNNTGIRQTKLVIPNSVTYIGASAFEQSATDTLIISDNVDSLRAYAFAGCNINYIHLPAKLKYIGDYALCNNNMRNFDLPDGVEWIGKWAVTHLSAKRVVIPESVKYIAQEAFTYTLCDTIEIRAHLDSIPTKAFYGCQSMKKIVLPANLKRIGYAAFGICRELKDCNLPEGLEEIDSYAFLECHIGEWHFPTSIHKIGRSAFPGRVSVYMYTQEPPADVHAWAFDLSEMDYSVLYVPVGSLENYQQKAPWNQFGTIREFEPTAISLPSLDNPIEPVRVYDFDGRQVNTKSCGLHIFVMPNGKTKKVICR